jgi:hypothetical protein
MLVQPKSMGLKGISTVSPKGSHPLQINPHMHHTHVRLHVEDIAIIYVSQFMLEIKITILSNPWSVEALCVV